MKSFRYEFKGRLQFDRVGQLWTLVFDIADEMKNWIKNDELFREIAIEDKVILQRGMDTYKIEHVDWNHKALVLKTIKDPFEDMR